jgi:hypothetical protein
VNADVVIDLKDAIVLRKPFLANVEVLIDLKDAKLMFQFGEEKYHLT